MITIIPLIASVTNEPVGTGKILTHFVPFQVVGMLVVMIALALLSGLCMAMGFWFGRSKSSKTTEAQPLPTPNATSTTPPVVDEDVTDPRIVAVIAAAITAVLDQPHRIIDIHAAGQPAGMTNAWAIEGRFQHFSSHKFR